MERRPASFETSPLPLTNRPFLTMTLSFLSSRAQPRDLQFRGPFLEMFLRESPRPTAAKVMKNAASKTGINAGDTGRFHPTARALYQGTTLSRAEQSRIDER